MKFSALATLTLAAVLPASAYYHFTNYLVTGIAPEKFDLSALPAKTVNFMVSENGPVAYPSTDTFSSVVAQIRQAAAIWNGVSTSDLRVSFGGLEHGLTPQNTPGGDVVFDDLPPGVEGMAGPTALTTSILAADGTVFVPIVRSVIHLNRNLMLAPGPSFNQSFLMTTLHEMGHALGLQHTFTSATMSQDTTRATTLSHPLDNDDIAGISVLYPNAAFSQFGSISGRITAGSVGVHLASVVAIQNGTGAVSAVTNPDGTFTIKGLLPGSYAVYVHTMPPDANIAGPWNADGNAAAASGPVNTLFFPGTTDINSALPVSVTAGNITSGINIGVTARSAVPYYDGQIFSFLGSTAVRPASIAVTNSLTTLAASVVGLGSNGQVSGLTVQTPGGSLLLKPSGVRPYLASNGYTYVALDVTPSATAQPGPQHVVFSTPDYTYVLPSAIRLTQTAPPTVSSLTDNGDGTLTVTGSGWLAGTQVYFDSVAATVIALDPGKGSALVSAPAGTNGQTATVIAYNPDGNNSLLIPAVSPVQYSYPSLATPIIASVQPATLPAGVEAAVDITGTGFNFVPGHTTVGFGTSDVTVRRVFVLSPNHLQADVSISPNASLSATDVTVTTDFAVALSPGAFTIGVAVPGMPAPVPVLFNALPGLTGSYAGAIVSLYGKNLALAGSNAPLPVVTIGGLAATILYASPSQINLQIPAGVAAGPAVLGLFNGSLDIGSIDPYRVVVNIDTPPAGFNAIQNGTGAYIDAALSAKQGDTIFASLDNFAPANANIVPSRVQISLGGVVHNPLAVFHAGSIWVVSFQIGANDPVGQAEQLVVYLDGRSSYPATIQVAHPDGTFLP